MLGWQDDVVYVYCQLVMYLFMMGEVWWSFVNLKMVKFGSDDIVVMQVVLVWLEQDVMGSLEDVFYLYFLFGKVFEDVGDFVVVFCYYDLGNCLCCLMVLYDVDEFLQEVVAGMVIFIGVFIVEMGLGGCIVCDLIFIFGLLCFGLMFVEQIFVSYSVIEGMMELFEMMMIGSCL